MKKNNALEGQGKKIVSLVILLLCLVLPVSAFEFDNIKEYDPVTKTVSFDNTLLGIKTTSIGTARLRSELHRYMFVNDYAFEIEFNMADTYDTGISKIDAYNKYTPYSSLGKQINQPNFILKKYNPTGTYKDTVYVYSNVCTGKDNTTTKCDKVLNYTYETEKTGTWETIDYATYTLPEGKTIIRGYYPDLKEGQTVEWIPTLFGLKVEEWADFTGLTRYQNSSSGGGGDLTGDVNYWECNGWSNPANFSMKGVNISMYKRNTPSGLKIFITDRMTGELAEWTVANVTGIVEADITTGTGGAWYTYFLTNNYTIQANKTYYICLGYTGDGFVWKGSSTNTYPNGNNNYHKKDGTVSGNRTYDAFFEIWGDSGAAPVVSSSVNVTLTYPANGYYTNQTFNTNATITPLNGNLTNATRYIWNISKAVINYSTTVLSGNSSVNVSYPVPLLSDGVYEWNVKACADDLVSTNCSFAVNNNTFVIDTVQPTIQEATNLTNRTVTALPAVSSWRYNVSDVNLNKCWYNSTENATITVVTCNATINTNWASSGYKTVYYYVNDSTGYQNSLSKTIFINHLRINQSFASSVIEGENTTIYYNITANIINSATVNLTYNGATYTMFGNNNGTFANYSRVVTAPLVSADHHINFTINSTVEGLTFGNNYTQLINNVANLTVSISPCGNDSLAFYLYDEQNFTNLNGTFEYNFYYGQSNNTLVQTFGKITNSHAFYVCANLTLYPNWTIGQGQIFYRTDGYADRRYYLFEGMIINNITQNISLYDLESSEDTSFQLTIESTSLDPYENVYTSILRWYPDLNEYKIVDMGYTDEKGSTVTHLRIEDVDYRIGVYYLNGSLIKLAEPIRLVCLSTPCSYTLKVSPSDYDFTSFLNVEYSITFNETTGIWNFIFNDPSGTTNTMNMTVYKDTGTSSYSICSSTVTGVSGAVSCNTSGYTGSLRAVVTRTASPKIPIVSKIVHVGTTAFKSTWGLWISFLIAVPLIFIFAVISPILAIIGGVLSLIPALYFGSVNMMIIGGLAILGGIVIHFLKRIS